MYQFFSTNFSKWTPIKRYLKIKYWTIKKDGGSILDHLPYRTLPGIHGYHSPNAITYPKPGV